MENEMKGEREAAPSAYRWRLTDNSDLSRICNKILHLMHLIACL
jgi:hypothetical protein